MEVKVSSDATDVDFHPDPKVNLFSTSLLSGKVQLFNYDSLQDDDEDDDELQQDNTEMGASNSASSSSKVKRIQSIRPTKKSIRSISFNPDGRFIWSASKDGNLYRIDLESYKIVDTWNSAHDSPISRILPIDENLIVSGDDSGLINLWDQRIKSGSGGTGSNSSSSTPIKSYSHHFDWITDFLWFDHLIPPKVKTLQELKLEEEKRKAEERSKKNRKRKKSKSEREKDVKDHLEEQKLEMRNRSIESGRSRLVCTSGDGTLSVIDPRAGSGSASSDARNPGAKGKNKTNPAGSVEVSEDQEDELLSMASVKGGSKLVIGTQLGMLSLWSPSRGLLDHVDRIPGHPSSVDSLCNLDDDTILSGSSDGLLRVVQILPHKLLGVINDNGGMPIERIKRKGNWVASLGHRDVVCLNDVKELLESDDEDEDDSDEDDQEEEEEGGGGGGEENRKQGDGEGKSENRSRKEKQSLDQENNDSDDDQEQAEENEENDSSESEKDNDREPPLKKGFQKLSNNPATLIEDDFFSGF